jgi:hypothetical protein
MVQESIVIDRPAKNRHLFLSILFDAVGMLSFIVPLLGELSDVIWAPIAAYIMTRIYKGTVGKAGGVIAFVEEIVPFTDLIPSFTLMWIYNYAKKKDRVR